MANQEHLDILKQGVETWNQWRKGHADLIADLSGAPLRDISLEEANLSFAQLSGADLIRANLSRADLSRADLRAAGLDGADLSSADLGLALLSFARLRRANLRNADLVEAQLRSAYLKGADLSNAIVAWTSFGYLDLSAVKGLETVRHEAPSIIDIDTIIRSQGNIPEIFLRKAGVPDSIIEAIPSLIGSLKTIDFYSCFISYSDKDRAFAERLYDDLQSKGVRCWFAPEDLKWGEKIRTGIDEAIHLHDKLLLILSKHSVASGWVEHEVKSALAKERKEKRIVLFPIRLDKAIFDSPLAWATEIRHERNIGDFTGWKQHDDYQKALARLLSELNVKTIRRL